MRVGSALLIGVALLAAACGRPALGGPAPGPELPSYQTLVAGSIDAEGNTLTQRFDSTVDRAQATAVPTIASDARFTATGAISYLLPDSIHTLGLAGGARTEATSPARVIDAFAWSDDGALAYVAHSSAPTSGSRLVIRPSRGAASAVALPPAVGGPTPILRFSPDGQLLLLVDPALGAAGTLQVRRLDGSLLFQAAAAAEATWAGSRRVYFMDARGVNVADLTTGMTRTILPGVRWRAPDASPDGRTLVFELAGERGVPRLELLDTSTDAVLPGFERDGGTTPRFVSPTEVWFHEMGGEAIVCLDLERRTETPTGLNGMVTDVRQVAAR
jgi:hypothetical protein